MKYQVHRDTITRYLKLSMFLQLVGVLPRNKANLTFSDWDTNLNIKSIGMDPTDPTGPYVLVEYK